MKKKEVSMNEVGAQIFKGTEIQSRKGSSRTNGGKVVYRCYICSSLDHRIHNCSHKQLTLEMFKRKNSIVELQKEKAAVNMVLIVTNHNKTMTHEDLKEKNLENQNLKELDRRGKVSTIF
jgi:hypothetical protein